MSGTVKLTSEWSQIIPPEQGGIVTNTGKTNVRIQGKSYVLVPGATLGIGDSPSGVKARSEGPEGEVSMSPAQRRY